MNERPNLNYINELAGDSDDFKNRLIHIVKKEFPEEKDEFLKNYNSNNWKLAAENVHKLKHKIGMMGFEEGYQITIDFEEELIQGNNTLYLKFILILESIENFLKQI